MDRVDVRGDLIVFNGGEHHASIVRWKRKKERKKGREGGTKEGRMNEWMNEWILYLYTIKNTISIAGGVVFDYYKLR